MERISIALLLNKKIQHNMLGELARLEMGTIIKRESGASEAFSEVMKTNNCFGLCVLTRNTCFYLACASSTGV